MLDRLWPASAAARTSPSPIAMSLVQEPSCLPEAVRVTCRSPGVMLAVTGRSRCRLVSSGEPPLGEGRGRRWQCLPWNDVASLTESESPRRRTRGPTGTGSALVHYDDADEIATSDARQPEPPRACNACWGADRLRGGRRPSCDGMAAIDGHRRGAHSPRPVSLHGHSDGARQ